MCDPITATAITLQVAAGGYKAYNQYQQGKSEGKYYDYLAQQSQQEGDLALKRGEKQANLIQDQAKEQEGKH